MVHPLSSNRTTFLIAFALFGLLGQHDVYAQKDDARLRKLLTDHCGECHDGESEAPEISFQSDWQTSANSWRRIYRAVKRSEMPPVDAEPIDDQTRSSITRLLRHTLLRELPVTRTPPRRLNSAEYQNTIRALFDLPDFRVPASFPADQPNHGFDTVATGLVVSPPLMNEYFRVASQVADQIIPPMERGKKPRPKSYSIGAIGLATSEGGSLENDDKYRIYSSRNMSSVAVWPNRFEATESGVYELSINASFFISASSPFKDQDHKPILEVYVRPKTGQVYDPFDNLKRAAQFRLRKAGEKVTFRAQIELTKGDVFGLRWSNGPIYSDPPTRELSQRFLTDRLKNNRRFHAAILKFGGGPRGINQSDYYDAMNELMASDQLDLANANLNTYPINFGGGLGSTMHNWIMHYANEELRRHGPAIDIHDVKIHGPVRLIVDQETRTKLARKRKFLGGPSSSAQQQIRRVLGQFLPTAFRSPIDAAELESYIKTATGQVGTEAMHAEKAEKGVHAAVRRALVSPRFLYREGLQNSKLDSHAIASRLSYFMTSAPPDESLVKLAANGQLMNAHVRANEVKRLIKEARSDAFVTRFAGQWLSLNKLSSIMADPRLLTFYDSDRDQLKREAEMFFAEMLRENHPLRDFIDPGFSHRNESLNKIYGGDVKGHEMQRVTFAKGGRDGGVLGMGAIMMATANGVDTHPVHRGVWILENLLGNRPPPPPNNVPAIASDASGKATIAQQLAIHRSDRSCAICHDRIDPLGIVMESFDPVGRWRENYPIYVSPPKDESEKKEFYANTGKGTRPGPKVLTEATLTDGTVVRDVVGLKKHLLTKIPLFAQCLTEKLMVYSLGRELSFADEIDAEAISTRVVDSGGGLADLIIEIVSSESFMR